METNEKCKNILIISDIHLGDYSSYGYLANTPGDFLKTAEKIKDLCVSNMISEIWILGDIVQFYLPKPNEMICIKKFFNILNFVKIRCLLGNHDTAEYFQKSNNSILTRLLKNCGMEILDNNIITINGKKIYFCSYNNKINTIHTDILLSHRDFGDIDNETSKLFDYIILGHNHSYYTEQNKISCGSILPHTKEELTDKHGGLILRINDKIEFKRIEL